MWRRRSTKPEIPLFNSKICTQTGNHRHAEINNNQIGLLHSNPSFVLSIDLLLSLYVWQLWPTVQLRTVLGRGPTERVLWATRSAWSPRWRLTSNASLAAGRRPRTDAGTSPATRGPFSFSPSYKVHLARSIAVNRARSKQCLVLVWLLLHLHIKIA